MAVTLMQHESEARSLDVFTRDEPCTIVELNRFDEAEVVEFLARRPIHTVFMATLIRNNGLLSPHNRGSFYAGRDPHGRLEGFALLGHATLIEARTDSSLAFFARLAPGLRIALPDCTVFDATSTQPVDLSDNQREGYERTEIL